MNHLEASPPAHRCTAPSTCSLRRGIIRNDRPKCLSVAGWTQTEMGPEPAGGVAGVGPADEGADGGDRELGLDQQAGGAFGAEPLQVRHRGGADARGRRGGRGSRGRGSRPRPGRSRVQLAARSASSNRIACWTAGCGVGPPGPREPESSPKTSVAEIGIPHDQPGALRVPMPLPGPQHDHRARRQRSRAIRRDMYAAPCDHDRDLEERVAVRSDVGRQFDHLTGDRQPRVGEDFAAEDLVHPRSFLVKEW